MKPRASILIGEDDDRARDSLRALLTDEGYRVQTARDGAEISRLLKEAEFDAVLLDVRMPGKDGLSLLRNARAAQAARGSDHDGLRKFRVGH